MDSGLAYVYSPKGASDTVKWYLKERGVRDHCRI